MDDQYPPPLSSSSSSIFPLSNIHSTFDVDMFADELLSFTSSSICFSAGFGGLSESPSTTDWLGINPSLPPFLLPATQDLEEMPDPFEVACAGMMCSSSSNSNRSHVMQQQQQAQTATFLQQTCGQGVGFGNHRLSPPRMHPNLVTTLKSILSPRKGGRVEAGKGEGEEEEEEEEDGGGKKAADGGAGAAEGGGMAAARGGAGVAAAAGGGAGAPAPAEEEEDVAAAAEEEAEEEVEATVVSLDLIKNRRPFTCSFQGCNKTFKNPQTMKMHFKTHYPGTDVCKLQRRNPPLAGSDSSTSNHPHHHNNNKHNKKIPSRCPLCRKTFVGLYELRRHFGRKHSDGEKSHGCRKCGKKFYIEVDLRDHEKVCGEPIQCRCGMKFAFKCNLVAHRKAHPQCQDYNNNIPSPSPSPSPSALASILLGANPLLGPNPNPNNNNAKVLCGLDRMVTSTTTKPCPPSSSSSLPLLNSTAADRSSHARTNRPFHDITNGVKKDA